MEAINYAPNGQNMILSEDAQIVQGVSGNACYLPAGTGKINIAGNRNEVSVSIWRQWDGIVEADKTRGIFSFKNFKVYFDNKTDFLTIILNDKKIITNIKDDGEQTHWGFVFVKNENLKIYKNSKLVYETLAGSEPVDFSDGFVIGGGRTHATFDEVRVYKTAFTQAEVNGLYYLISKGTQVKQVESIVAGVTPKYLGVTEAVPTTRQVIIKKGERLGTVDANAGDWVLMSKTVGGWKCGVCYRWSAGRWINLEPEHNYEAQYQACLMHICEIPELVENTGHYGALFAKMLVAQKALIDNLIAKEAFIKKLAADQAFLKELIVQRLKIDSDRNSNKDFEAWFDETNGLKIMNKGKEIFKVDTSGNIVAQNALLQNGTFTGDIYSGPLELSSRAPNSKIIEIREDETIEQLIKKYGNCGFFCSSLTGIMNIVKISMSQSLQMQNLVGRKEVFKPFPNPPPGAPPGTWKTTYVLAGYFMNRISTLKIYLENSEKEYNHQIVTDIQQRDQTARINLSVGQILEDTRIETDTVVQAKEGAKTYKLKDIPTMPSREEGIVWVDINGFLKLS